MTHRVAAAEVLLLSAQSAAAQATASAAAAAAEAERQLVIENERRRLARAKATKDIDNIISGIKIAARLGKTSAFFGAVDEDDDFYWEYIAEDLRALGYEVDIQFVEERRRFRQQRMHEDRRELHNPYRPSRHVELIEVDTVRYNEDHGDSPKCCGVYEKDKIGSHVHFRDLVQRVEDITVTRCWILEILWWLTLLGPFIGGACEMFGFFAIVSDPSGWRTTCRAPYTKNACWLKSTSSCGAAVGAIWYVRVSWAPARTVLSASAATSTPEKPLSIPIATPIDGFVAVAPRFSPTIRGSLE